MKKALAFVLMMTLLVTSPLLADDVTIVEAATEAGDGLDLNAVAALLQDSEDLESFEQRLNDPETQINNVDADGDGNVDYIRVLSEQPADGQVLIVLQVALDNDQFQDLATIEIEQGDGEDVKLQITGDPVIYGADYYIVPAPTIRISTWPLIRPMFLPGWRPYYSPWYWGYYPPRWRVRPVVSVNIYRTHTTRWVRHGTFVHTSHRHTVHVHKHYHRKTTDKVVLKSKSRTSQQKAVKAGSKATKANQKATKANQKSKKANQKATKANQKSEKANQKATKANQKSKKANQKATKAKQNPNKANQKATKAKQKPKKANQKATKGKKK